MAEFKSRIDQIDAKANSIQSQIVPVDNKNNISEEEFNDAKKRIGEQDNKIKKTKEEIDEVNVNLNKRIEKLKELIGRKLEMEELTKTKS